MTQSGRMSECEVICDDGVKIVINDSANNNNDNSNNNNTPPARE